MTDEETILILDNIKNDNKALSRVKRNQALQQAIDNTKELKKIKTMLDNDLVDKEVVRIINNGVDVNDREKEWQEKKVHITLIGLTEDEYNLLEHYRASGIKIRILGEPYKES